MLAQRTESWRAWLVLAATLGACGGPVPPAVRSGEPPADPSVEARAPQQVAELAPIRESEVPTALAPGFGAVRLVGAAHGMGVPGCDGARYVDVPPQHVIELSAPLGTFVLRSTTFGAHRLLVLTSEGCLSATRTQDARPVIAGSVPAGTLRIFVGSEGHSLPFDLTLSER